MKKLQNLVLLSVFAITLVINACRKVDEAPKIILDEPTEGMLVSGEVHIHGRVTDEELHNLNIKVTKDADSSVLFTLSRHWHGKSEFGIDEHFTPSGITGETAVTLFIEVEDEADQVTTKTVRFRVKP